jgi:hypothetical protein
MTENNAKMTENPGPVGLWTIPHLGWEMQIMQGAGSSHVKRNSKVSRTVIIRTYRSYTYEGLRLSL